MYNGRWELDNANFMLYLSFIAVKHLNSTQKQKLFHYSSTFNNGIHLTHGSPLELQQVCDVFTKDNKDSFLNHAGEL